MVAIDNDSTKDFEAFARQTGNPLLSSAAADKEFVFYIRKKQRRRHGRAPRASRSTGASPITRPAAPTSAVSRAFLCVFIRAEAPERFGLGRTSRSLKLSIVCFIMVVTKASKPGAPGDRAGRS